MTNPGIPNPWLVLGVALAWGASIVAVGAWQRHDGGLAATNECLVGKTAALKGAADDLQKHVANEHHLEDQLAQAGVDYATGLKENQDQRDADVAAAYARGIRLRAPGSCVATGAAPSGSAPASGGDGQASCELSPATSANLLQLADDADGVAKQLGACQTVVLTYAKGCHP